MASKKPAKKEPIFLGFSGYKGGVGKTSVALNIAALLSTKGYKVAFYEQDEQSSFEALAGMRGANFPFALIDDINAVPDDVDFVVVDWPPGLDGEQLNGEQDVLTVMLQPATLDWKATEKGLKTLSDDNKRVIVVNRLKRNNKDHQKILEVVRAKYANHAVATIYERHAMQRATNRATTAYGLANNVSGVRELRTDIEEVANAIFAQLNMELPV